LGMLGTLSFHAIFCGPTSTEMEVLKIACNGAAMEEFRILRNYFLRALMTSKEITFLRVLFSSARASSLMEIIRKATMSEFCGEGEMESLAASRLHFQRQSNFTALMVMYKIMSPLFHSSVIFSISTH